MTAYYNEIDPYAAQWLRNLIAAGHIAPGDVDERSIVDVRPDDLRGYTQCHFFAGIGVWSHALRRAGWEDDRPVWTGSCPCQPFSAAGKGYGFADERHLWPYWYHLISQCKPPVIFGEQVASKDALVWLDLVQPDMEGAGYAFWPVDLCAAGVGAPHIRQRLWFVAEGMDYALRDGRANGQTERRSDGALYATSTSVIECSDRRETYGMADTTGNRQRGCRPSATTEEGRQPRSAEQRVIPSGPEGRAVPSVLGTSVRDIGELGNTPDEPRERDAGGVSRAQAEVDGARRAVDGGVPVRPEHAGAGMGELAESHHQGLEGWRLPSQRAGKRTAGESGLAGTGRPSPTNGFWRDADWLFCRDGKWRPVEPGTFPLAHGAASRVGRLRAYGNAIVSEAAQAVIETYLEHRRVRVMLSDLPPAQGDVFL